MQAYPSPDPPKSKREGPGLCIILCQSCAQPQLKAMLALYADELKYRSSRRNAASFSLVLAHCQDQRCTRPLNAPCMLLADAGVLSRRS